jgi:hypothetical protein
MVYAISAVFMVSSTEQNANVCRDFWATGKYAEQIQNLPMRHWG